MKKNILLGYLLISFIFIFTFVGCGKTTISSETVDNMQSKVETEEPSITQESDVESVSEETKKDEEYTQIKENEEIVNQIPNSEDVWKTVKETEDICIVVMNEKTGNIEIINSNGIGSENATVYMMKEEGSKILIPLRENIQDIDRFTDREEVFYSTDSVGVDYPIVDMGDSIKAVEIEDIQEEFYNIMIYISDVSEHIEFLIIHDYK